MYVRLSRYLRLAAANPPTPRIALPWLCLLLAGCATNPAGDPWLARDKALHFIAGAAVGAIGAGIAQSRDFSPCGATSAGIGLAFSVGLGKEWHDRYSPAGTASGRDLLATLAGGLIGAQLVGECQP